MSWKIYCDFENDLEGNAMEGLELPGIYNDRTEADEAVQILVRQKTNELSGQGLYVTYTDIHTGTVCTTDGYGKYVTYNYYSRRR